MLTQYRLSQGKITSQPKPKKLSFSVIQNREQYEIVKSQIITPAINYFNIKKLAEERISSRIFSLDEANKDLEMFQNQLQEKIFLASDFPIRESHESDDEINIRLVKYFEERINEKCPSLKGDDLCKCISFYCELVIFLCPKYGKDSKIEGKYDRLFLDCLDNIKSAMIARCAI